MPTSPLNNPLPDRVKAMNWWNDLKGPRRLKLAGYYFPGRAYHSLTGREIETIWKGENNIWPSHRK